MIVKKTIDYDKPSITHDLPTPHVAGFVSVGDLCLVKVYAQTETEYECFARLIAASPDLLLHGKHLAVKLAEVYRASGINPADCQAIRDWMAIVAKIEGK
jgi:hypothetical protein